MEVESNGVMHKKWIRNEGKMENMECGEGGGRLQKQGGTEEKMKLKKEAPGLDQ